MAKIEYLTTAIVYPNSKIHVGWAWECLGTDWLARSHRAMGRPTYFVTGMDEHSLNVQKAAEQKGLTPKAYCDEMAGDIRSVLEQMGMKFDRFIRTSDDDHVRIVQALVKKSFDKGDIYLAKYEGHYCESCEAYYTEKDLTDGNCPTHGKPAKWVSEENYFFRLSKYQAQLEELFEKNPEFLQPASRRSEIVNFIKTGLKDFSVSRSTFTWGVPLPWKPEHIIYVWFDALINYLTAAGIEHELKDPKSVKAQEFRDRWATAFHVVGKDIARFHCIYWPAMLMSLDLPLPKTVFVHGWLMLKGEKMSKSTGIKVHPDDVMNITGPDPFRYYLLAENQFSGDGNFAWESLIDKTNADLSNDWGNLVNRSISMTRKYFPDEALKAPSAVTLSAEVIASFQALKGDLQKAIDAVDPMAYAQACTARSRVLNLFIDQMKPWKMAKEESQKEELKEVLYTLLEGIRWVATAFLPILPFGMPKVFAQLGVTAPAEQGAIQSLKWGETSYKPLQPEPIYPRLELPEGV